jgi:4a-hydroxytetrahydrobiopterin dehydratase
MADLASRTCEPCRSGATPLRGKEIEPLLAQIDSHWECVDEHHLRREFRFKNFAQALAFTNRVGALAEEQFHHPDIHLGWGRVVLEVWTHKARGLLEADFIFAAKCDRLYAES